MIWNEFFPTKSLQATLEIASKREVLYLPVLKPAGPGGTPGRGERPAPPRRGGSPRVDQRLIAVSNPPAPDNRTQTILQAPSPPNVRIPVEVRLPNIVLGRMEIPQPPPDPKVPIRSIQRPKPKPVLPPPPVPKPAAEVPQPPRLAAELAMRRPPSVSNLSPRLALPEPPPPPSQAEDVVGAIKALPVIVRGQGSAAELLSLSIHPEPLGSAMALPPGNRQGAFSISPEGGDPGALGGVPSGVAGGGSGGPGAGGDASVGPGPGREGGGGTESTGPGTVMVEPLGGAADGGFLPEIIRKWLFPDDTPPVVRRGGFVISSGPVGGGGLRIYGVFKGGNKVYTSYLPMKDKDWVLEYTLTENGNSQPEAPQRGMVVALQDSLAPPWPEKKFDFYRPALVKEKAARMIVLHGRIGEDGQVNGLEVLQSVQEDADRLALAAFSQWKFRPATRSGKPVGVEILVGIPATGPQKPADGGEGSGLLSAQ